MADDQKKGKKIDPLAAGVVGAAVGAAAATLAHQESRKKVKKAVEDVQEKGGKAVHDLTSTLDTEKDKAVKEIEKTAEEAKKKISETGK